MGACAHTHPCTDACPSACAEERGQPVQVSSLLLPCDPEDQTEVVRLGGKCRFQLSLCICPHLSLHITVWKPKSINSARLSSTELSSHAPACPPQPVCTGVISPNYVCRNNLAPGVRTKLIYWLHAVKAERLPSSALLGSNANSLLSEMKSFGQLPITPQKLEQGLTNMSTCILFGDPSNKVLSRWCRPSSSSTGETARGHWELNMNQMESKIQCQVKEHSFIYSYTYSETLMCLYKPMHIWQSLSSNSMSIWAHHHTYTYNEIPHSILGFINSYDSSGIQLSQTHHF